MCSSERMKGILIEVPRELSKKIIKESKKNVAWCLTPVIDSHVPDSPDPDKTILGIRLERALARRIKRMAEAENITMTDLVRRILIEATINVKLTSKDYEEIASEVRKAEAKRKDPRRKN